jgi:proline dehydrogenase
MMEMSDFKKLVDFDNTEIAFKSKSNFDLKKAVFLFKMISKSAFVKLGKRLTNFALRAHLPVSWLVKPTIFSHFCGGISISDCSPAVSGLYDYGIGSILDYSAEGLQSEESFNEVEKEVVESITIASTDERIPFAVFKPSGIGRFGLYEKVSQNLELDADEKDEFARLEKRFENICHHAYLKNVPVMVDAEESWIQKAVDNLVKKYSILYNKKRAIVFNTLQMYRTDRLDKISKDLIWADTKEIKLGYKLVRGAYMEKERERARELKYDSPVFNTKAETDEEFNKALSYCFENLEKISLVVATHNEDSNELMVNLMNDAVLPNSHSDIWFAQLYGMSDHISYNLAFNKYNVAKYLPYGPVKKVLPYLIRRAEENTSVAGQTGRELNLLLSEKLRRRKSKA